jgi:hypothetical protein
MPAEPIDSILPNLMRWLPTMAAAGGLDGFAREVHANLPRTMRRDDVAQLLGDRWLELLRESIRQQLTYRLADEVQREYDKRIQAFSQRPQSSLSITLDTFSKLTAKNMMEQLRMLIDAVADRIAVAQGVKAAPVSSIAQLDRSLEKLIDTIFKMRDQLRAPGMAEAFENMPANDQLLATLQRMFDAHDTFIQAIQTRP